MTCTPAWNQDLERLFVGALSAAEERRLHEHTAECADCRRSHDRIFLLERALASGGDTEALDRPSHFELERIGRRILGDRPSARPPGVLVGAGLAALLSAAAVLAVMVAGGPEAQAPSADFTPKAGGAAAPVGTVALRAFTGAVDSEGRTTVQPLSDGAVVEPGAPLTFTVTHEDPAVTQLRVRATDSAGEVAWLGDAPTPLGPPAAEAPMGATFAAPQRPGPVVIEGVFTGEGGVRRTASMKLEVRQR